MDLVTNEYNEFKDLNRMPFIGESLNSSPYIGEQLDSSTIIDTSALLEEVNGILND